MAISPDNILLERYAAEGINPETKAFALIDGAVYMTVAGMEIKAMRSGVLAGKSAVVFGQEVDAVNPHDQKDINIPTSAIATYQRIIMDQPRDFSSDPVQFHEYAKKRWHYEKPFMFLAKIARACALRHAFPDIFAGVISYEEMQCELNFDREQKLEAVLQETNRKHGDTLKKLADIPKKPDILTRETSPKQESNLPTSPKAVSDMVAAIFKQGVQS